LGRACDAAPQIAGAEAPYLLAGGNRVAADCLADPGPDADPLLARHSLGRALTVPDSAAKSLLVVVIGPTASGKTALAVALAERFQGEVVNCDSVAVYREFCLGTAKPSAQERARVPHHLLDFVEPYALLTAGEYARQARRVLLEIRDRAHLPIMAGGTGLYLRALLEGLFPGPQRSEELRRRLRDRATHKGAGYLHRLLRRLDPESAGKIHANDTPKLIRAIEVCLASRRPMSELWKQGRDALQGFRILRLGLNPQRELLYRRINERAKEMFEAGLVEETRALLEKYGESPRAMSSLGYKQALQLLKGEMSEPEAIAATQQGHRNYAKRQMTWFRREPDVVWLEGFGDGPEIQKEAADLVCGALGK
jgi:tRNA dimethylallyltransferase